jgi:hypothetical protein
LKKGINIVQNFRHRKIEKCSCLPKFSPLFLFPFFFLFFLFPFLFLRHLFSPPSVLVLNESNQAMV